MNLLLVILVLFIALLFTKGIKEHLSGSPATLIQLASSSTTPPYFPPGFHPNLRPVNQRGMYFNNPSWIRM